MNQIHLLGLSSANLLLLSLLQRRGNQVQLWVDRGEDLAQIGGVTAHDLSEPEQASLREASLGDGMDFELGARTVVSTLGAVRQVNASLPGILSLQVQVPVAVLGFRGWREWSASAVTSGLAASAFNARVVEVQLHGAPLNASLHQMAAQLSDAVLREQIVAALKRELAPTEALLLPPVLSRLRQQKDSSVRALLAAELQRDISSIGEAVGSVPSLTGERYLEQTLRALGKRAVLRGEGKLPACKLEGEQLQMGGDHNEFVGSKDDLYVVGSHRFALWLKPLIAAPLGHQMRALPTQARAAKNVWFVGRARNARSVGEEWREAFRLLKESSFMSRAEAFYGLALQFWRHVLSTPLRKTRGLAELMADFRHEGVRDVTPKEREAAPYMSRCSGCGRCDFLAADGPDREPPSLVLLAAGRQSGDAPLMRQRLMQLQPYAVAISAVCPEKVDVPALLLRVERLSREEGAKEKQRK